MSGVDKKRRSSATWQSLYNDVSIRISDGYWKPGELIPKEAELAKEFGCARATVNRALRQLAEEGFLDRRRKAGTRVALHPIRKATLDIPITRLEVEQRGGEYGYRILTRKQKAPPKQIKNILGMTSSKPLYVETVHMADDKPFMYETRWINAEAVPAILKESFDSISANEWLVENVLLTTGEISFSAANATAMEAEILEINTGNAIFVTERITWNGPHVITAVRLAYSPSFKMSTKI